MGVRLHCVRLCKIGRRVCDQLFGDMPFFQLRMGCHFNFCTGAPSGERHPALLPVKVE